MPRVKAVPQKRLDHNNRSFVATSADRTSLLQQAACHDSNPDPAVDDEFEGMFVEDHDSEAEDDEEDGVTPKSLPSKLKRANVSLSTPRVSRTKRQKMYPSSLASDEKRVQKTDDTDLLICSLPVYWYDDVSTNLDQLLISISGADIFICDTQTTSIPLKNVGYVINHDIEEVSETIWRRRLRALQQCVDHGYIKIWLGLTGDDSFNVVLNLTLSMVDKMHKEYARIDACLVEMIVEINLRSKGEGSSIFKLVDQGITSSSFPTDNVVNHNSISSTTAAAMSFDADSFLHEITMHTQLILSRIPMTSLEEMVSSLKSHGLRTTLRPYQQQATHYLYSRYVNAIHTSNSSNCDDNGVHNDISTDCWVKIPLSSAGQRNDCSSSSSSSRSSRAGIDLFQVGKCQLWYNLLSGQLCYKRDAPLDTNSGARAAIMLSDEPGLGKTIQILSLILLVKLHGGVSDQMVVNTLRETIYVQAERRRDANMIASTNIVVEAPMLQIWHDESELEQQELGCLCCTKNSKDEKSGYIQCDQCNRWLHISCCGFGSQEAANGLDMYVCVGCANLNLRKLSPLIAVNTVLVIVPDPLLSQWIAEVWKHFHRGEGEEHPLKVAVYDGCEIKTLRKNKKSFKDIQPESLAQVDVLLITLRTLQKEFYLSNLFPSGEEQQLANADRDEQGTEYADSSEKGNTRSLRYESKTNDYFPPPFLCVKYKLVVVDETQKIEGITETVAMSMAKRIAAGFRISVSATPLGHNSLRDIAALCNFLHVRPLNEAVGFKSIFERKIGHLQMTWASQDRYLKRLLFPSFVRRTKQAVQDQLGIPPKLFITRKLNMSQFEYALYKERETPIIDNLHLANGNEDINAKIMVLRKGCCHPQILDPALYSRHHNKGSREQGPRPFAEIMVLKVEQMRQKCEELQRNLLFQLFTMGGVALLQAEIAESDKSHMGLRRAMQVYSLSLQVLEKNRREVDVIGIAKITGDASFKKQVGMACLGTMLLEWHEPRLCIKSGASSMMSSSSSTHFTSSSSLLLLTEGVACGAHVDIGFNTGRRVLSVSIGGVSVHEYFSLRNRNSSNSSSRRSSSSSGGSSSNNNNNNNNSSSSSNGTIGGTILVFPKECELLASKSIGDTLSPVHRFSVPMPSLSDLQAPNGPPSHSESIPLGSFRAKTWRLDIKRVHRTALLVTLNGSNELQCTIIDLEEHPNAVSQYMAISLNVQEALFDVDFMQELHLFSSMIHTHDQIMSLQPPQSSKADVMNDLPEVQETTLEMLSPHFQIPSSNDASRHSSTEIKVEVPSFNIPTSAMASRRDNIERNFLQTTANRRDVTLYHLQELRDNINDDEKHLAAMGVYEEEEEEEEKEEAVVAVVEKGVHMSSGFDIGYRWWLPILEKLRQGMGPDFFFLLDDTVASGGEAYRSLANCRTIVHLGSIIEREHKELMAARVRAVETMTSMNLQPTAAEVEEVSNCRVCCAYFLKTGPKCFLCKRKDVQEEYRKKLFAYRSSTKRLVTQQSAGGKKSKRGNNKNNNNNNSSSSSSSSNRDRGHRLGGLFEEDEGVEMKDTEEAQVKGTFHMLTVLLKNYCNRLSIDAKPVTLQVKILAKMENELKVLHSLWNRQSEFIKAHDELEMCKSRLQLLPADVEKPIGQEESYIWPHELGDRYYLRFQEAVTARRELGQAMSSLAFFKSQIFNTRSSRSKSGSRGRSIVQTITPGISAMESEKEEAQGGKDIDMDSDEESESDHVCPICREDLEVTVDNVAQEEGERICILPCAHRFHELCIKEWSKRASRCPCCKTKITSTDLRTFVGPTLHNEIEVDTAVANGRSGDATTGKTSEGEEAVVRIVGQWGTKIDSLVLDLLLLRMKEETSSDKCVVFSQWIEVLDIVSNALYSNGLNFVMCSKKQDFSPRKNLSRFRSDPSVQVLLLPINLGAEGLDLVHANHVFLLEPLINKSTEIQAINRCDRLGQCKTTRVVKYIIRGTIEERILNQSEELSAPRRLHSRMKKKDRLKDELHDLDEVRFLLTGNRSRVAGGGETNWET